MGFQGGMAMKMRIALALLMMVWGGGASAQVISGSPYLAVRGQASQEVTPDTFPLELTLTETSLDAAGTQARIERLAKEVLAIADGMKLKEADLTVSNVSISPEYKYDDKTEKEVFLGNTYKREIKVRLHSLERLREFIGSLPSDKALRIDTGRFATSRSDELRRGLLQKAIENARQTAEALAAGIDRKLGPVHTISSQGFNISYSESKTSLDSVYPRDVMGVALLAPGVIVLREGRITLDQNVYIVYALE